MATAVQKIASLGERRDIPFNKLILSQANVRKTKAGVSISINGVIETNLSAALPPDAEVYLIQRVKGG